MIWVSVATAVILGGFCVALYMGQEKRQLRHDEQVAKLVQQITRTNPADATLKAMKLTSGVLTDAVDKVTSTIGSLFAAATGLSPVGDTVVNPAEPEPDDDNDPAGWIPDTEYDGIFVQADVPNGNGFISAPVDQ